MELTHIPTPRAVHAYTHATVLPPSVNITDRNNTIPQAYQAFDPVRFATPGAVAGAMTPAQSQPHLSSVDAFQERDVPGFVHPVYPNESFQVDDFTPSTHGVGASRKPGDVRRGSSTKKKKDVRPTPPKSYTHPNLPWLKGKRRTRPQVGAWPPGKYPCGKSILYDHRLWHCPWTSNHSGNVSRHQIFDCEYRTPAEIQYAITLTTCKICYQILCRPTNLVDHLAYMHGISPPRRSFRR